MDKKYEALFTPWKIGNVEIKNRIVFAPMAGISNEAFRGLIKEMDAGLIYSEMVSNMGIIYNSKNTIDMLKINEKERPISIQIFGSDLDSFIKAAKFVEEYAKPDIIDINMGCPVPKVAVKSQAGSGLLKNPEKIYEIVKAVVDTVNIPVTVKIRSGWNDSNINCIEVAKLIEKAGASAIAIHPRTREQGYSGKADWDIIKKVNGETVNTNYQVSRYIEKSQGDELQFQVLRGDETLSVTFKAAFSVSEGKYKAGLWIRDSSAGIGTVSFCMPNGAFASLGHAVCDIDTKEVLPISQGSSTDVNITGIIKGSTAATGEICGVLEQDETGKILCNGSLGVYGVFDNPPQGELYEIAPLDQVEAGSATVYTTVENGILTQFEIEIVSVDPSAEENKNLVLKVRDKSILEKTGGIIQGMSGSPIVQNDRIVGVVTHVFLNDPTGGYGIFASTMYEKLQTETY